MSELLIFIVFPMVATGIIKGEGGALLICGMRFFIMD